MSFLFEKELHFRREIYRPYLQTSIPEMTTLQIKSLIDRLAEMNVTRYDKLKINVGEVLSEYERFIFWYLEEGKSISDMDIQIESFFRTSVIKGRKINTFKKDSLCCEYKKQALAVKPNGDVVACTAFTNLVIGNLQQDSIGEIWYSEKMQKIKQIKVSCVKECIDCEYLYLCGTGCRRMALSKTGSLFAKDESACEIYKFIHNKIIPMFNEFQLQINFN